MPKHVDLPNLGGVKLVIKKRFNKEQGIAEIVSTEDIEKAAYFKAESRGFEHGHDWQDWFEAEKELREQIGLAGGSPIVKEE